jgi:hypothetical protein
VALTLKGCGAQYTAIYTIYTMLTKFKIHVLYNYVFETLLYTLSYGKGKTTHIGY